MMKKFTKRILSALLCAALLAGGAVSASAAPIPTESAGQSISQRSAIGDLVSVEAHNYCHGGYPKGRFYITAPVDATITDIQEITNYGSVPEITYSGNTAFVKDRGSEELITLIITVQFPDGSATTQKVIDPYETDCGHSHPFTDRCAQPDD